MNDDFGNMPQPQLHAISGRLKFGQRSASQVNRLAEAATKPYN